MTSWPCDARTRNWNNSARGLFHADRYGHSAFSFLTSAANFSPYRRSKPRRPPAIQ
jgi:hypothetical protein